MKNIFNVLTATILIFCSNWSNGQSLEAMRESWEKLPAGSNKSKKIFESVKSSKLDETKKIELWREALSYIPNLEEDTLSAHIYYSLGKSYFGTEDYVKSLESFNQALNYFKISRNKYWIATTYIQLGNVFERQERLDEAERMFLMTQKIGKEINNNRLIAFSYNSLSIVYDKRKQSQKALELGIIGLKYLKSAKLDDDYLTSLVNIGIHHKNLGQFDEAIEKYKEALSLKVAQADSFSLAAIYINLAWAYNGKKAYKQGISAAWKGIDYSKGIAERKYFQADAYEILSKMYEAQKLWEQAYKAYQNKVAINDSISNLEIKSKIVELEEKNKTIEKETRIKELDFQNRNKLNVIFSGLALIIVLIFAWVMVFRKNSIIRKNNELLTEQNSKIQEQSDRLVLMMKELHHRVKNNLSIVASLLNLQTYGLTDQDAIKAVQTGQKRVEAMSLIHQKLYQTNHITSLNIKEYITDLVENIMESYGFNSQNFELKLDIEQTDIDVDLAIPIGLILNELVTNAFKYAYKEIPNPMLEITFKASEEVYLKVRDNGVGIDLEKWNTKGRRSFGKQLIISLSKQVSGKYKIENNGGTVFELEILKENKAA